MERPFGTRRQRLKNLALGSSALSLLLVLGGGVAFAQAPGADTLPGPNVTASTGGVFYSSQISGLGTINLNNPGGATVLEWGGNAGNPVGQIGVDQRPSNPGFSIGQGATVNIGNGAATLIIDATGAPSEIFGTLNTTGQSQSIRVPVPALTGPLYIANASGLTVGSGGVINAPTGLGLLGYGLQTSDFANGAVSINSSEASGGAVIVQQGATITTGGTPLLIAGNGAVNVSGPPSANDAPSAVAVLAGYRFTTGPNSATPENITLLPGSGASVTLSGGASIPGAVPASTFRISQLDAAGAVNVTGNVDLSKLAFSTKRDPATDSGVINGVFTNSGSVTLPSVLTTGGNIVNSGTMNTNARDLSIVAGNPSSPANFQSSGAIYFVGAGALAIAAQNISLGGSIAVNAGPLAAIGAPPATSAANPLRARGENAMVPAATGLREGVADEGLTLAGGYGFPNGATPSAANAKGVVDIATDIFTDSASISGQAVRILTGRFRRNGVTAVGDGQGNGVVDAIVGTGHATDPFASNATLAENFSLFPGTVYASTNNAETEIQGALASATSPGTAINLNGVAASATAVRVSGNAIEGNAGGHGGFELAGGGTLALAVSGDVNDPNGAKAAGSTDFRYNFVPVAVSGGSGPVTIQIGGPTAAVRVRARAAAVQDINLLVEGDAALAPTETLGPDGRFTGALTPPVTPTTPITPYADNHLVLQATGSITLKAGGPIAPDGNPTFYWPGLVYLSNATSAADPVRIDSGSITLGNANSPVSLNNMLPADLTKPNVSGSVGQGGVSFMTKNLAMNGASVTISNDSRANFIDAETASAVEKAEGANFFGGVITSSGALDTQTLPTSDFQPNSGQSSELSVKKASAAARKVIVTVKRATTTSTPPLRFDGPTGPRA